MNPEVAARFAAAYATWLGGTRVVIGRDSRASGPALSAAASAALRFLGINVIDVGIAATPTVELMVGRLGCDGGIIITASHNNEKWNALKLLVCLEKAQIGEYVTASQTGIANPYDAKARLVKLGWVIEIAPRSVDKGMLLAAHQHPDGRTAQPDTRSE